MSMALVIIGGLVILISIIVGISTGAFLGFLIWLTGGVSIGMILFAFSQIIENQLSILYQLQAHNEFTRHLHKKLIKCPRCNHEYYENDDTHTSCPNCGYRDTD